MNAYHTPVAEIVYPLEGLQIRVGMTEYYVDGSVEVLAYDSDNWDAWLPREINIKRITGIWNDEELDFSSLTATAQGEFKREIKFELNKINHVAEALEEEYLSWRR